MQVIFKNPALQALAHGGERPEDIPAEVATALQAAVWSMEAASSRRDITMYRHIRIASVEGEESLLELEGGAGLSYTAEGDTITVSAVLTPVRMA